MVRRMTLTAADLPALHLAKGAHDTPEQGICLLEAVALFAGEPFTDDPSCVSPVLRAFGIASNDEWDDVQRQKLKLFIPRLVGTAGDGQDQARSYLALDWLIRTFTPAWLDLAGLSESAAELRGLRRIADMATAEAAGPVAREARSKAHAAVDAAGDATGDAGDAGDAARAAARDAAWDAAVDAAGVAAGDAAWAAVDAARAAARDAAWDAAVDAAVDAAGDAAWAAVDAAGAAARDAARAATGDARAAVDAAWDAAVYAAVYAAGDAAVYAAGDAAVYAAGAAAWDAAWAAAGVAAGDALRPTVEQLQASALDLFEKMLDPAAVTA
jgi:hypothetical protein